MIIFVGILSFEIDAPLSKTKAISTFEGKSESVSFETENTEDKTNLLELHRFSYQLYTFWLQICLSIFISFQCKDLGFQKNLDTNFIKNLLDADADLERGLDGGRGEWI